MKKFYYLLACIAIVLVTIIACEKPSIEVEAIQAVQDEEVLLAKGKEEKVTICHYDWEVDEYYQISVNGHSVGKHLSQHRYDESRVQFNDSEFDGTVIYLDSQPDFTPGVTSDDNLDGDDFADCVDCNTTTINGLDSEKTLKYYKDFDGDGYGDATIFILKCDVENLPDKYMKDGSYYILDGTDCDDTVAAFTPEGSYIFRKVIDRGGTIGIIAGDYFVNISADDGNGDFTGTGERNLTDPVRIAYVNITGNVDDTGAMTFLMEQWIDDSTKTGAPQNYWTIDGTVLMCDGISEIHWVSGKEGVHVFTLFEE